MLIERIDIESFGKIKNVSIAINNRINVFYGANESGKSTIVAFLKFMFFGYTGMDKTKLSENERKLYSPWNADKIAGSLIVHFKDRKYKIEREYSELERTRIIDLSTNVNINEDLPGEFFFKMNEEAFCKTAFLKQLDSTEIGGEKLADMIHNILFTADEDLNTQKAFSRLREIKRGLKEVKEVKEIKVEVKSKESENKEEIKENKKEEKTEKIEKIEHAVGMIPNFVKKHKDLKVLLENSQNEQREYFKIEGTIKDLEEKMLANNAKKNELADELENYKAYNASQELQKIEAARRQVETLKQSEEKTIEKHVHEDFVPTHEFSRSLAECAKKVGEQRKRLEKSREQLNNAKEKYEDLEEKNRNYKIIEQNGGEEEVGGEYTRRKNAARNFKALSVFSGIFSGLSLIGFAVLYLLKIFDNLIVGAGVTLLFAMFIFVFSALAKNARKSVVEYYETFDFKEEHDFAAVLDDYNDTEAQLAIFKGDLDKCQVDFSEKEKDFNKVYSEARDLLLKWNRTPESDDKAAEDFLKFSKLASEAAEEIEKAKNIHAQYKAKLETMIDGIDERNLRRIAAAARKPNYDENHIERELNFLNKQNQSIAEKNNELGRNIAAAKLPDPVILQSQIIFLQEKINDLTQKQEALELAIITLEESCAELKNSVSPHLCESASELFSVMSGGKYTTLFINQNLELEFGDMSAATGIFGEVIGANNNTNSNSNSNINANTNSSNNNIIEENIIKRNIEYLSAGTRDAAYLCLRMALLDLLFENEMPPLICDESFQRLDASRLKNFASVIEMLSRKSQIFIFTCHERERDCFQQIPETMSINM